MKKLPPVKSGSLEEEGSHYWKPVTSACNVYRETHKIS